MIKLTLTIDEDFDKDDLIRAINANYAYDCIDEIMIKMMNMINHGYINNRELTEVEIDLCCLLQKEFLNIIEDLPGRM